MKMATNKKSPLKRKPGRMPGQSLDDDISQLRDKLFSEELVIVVVFLMVAMYDWLRWYTDTPIRPVTTTLLATVALLWFFFSFYRMQKKLSRLKLGRDGERAVGQFLERARVLGYDVFHDVICAEGNIDHLIVGPGGVFTIETKTYSKPSSGRAVITYDVNGGSLHKGKFDISHCLNQAKAQAGEMRELFGEYVAQPVKVQPVVVFPGWYIDSKGCSPRDVWVLEPKAFMKWVKNRSTELEPNAVNAVRQVLARHIYEHSAV